MELIERLRKFATEIRTDVQRHDNGQVQLDPKVRDMMEESAKHASRIADAIEKNRNA